MEKKAQAGVIAIILIILIVMVLVAIVGNVVVPLIRERSGETGIGRFSVDLGITNVAVFETGASKISVRRGAGGEIDSLKFVFYDENGEVKTEDAETLGELETKIYSFSPLGLGKINKVSVFPVINDQLGIESKSEAKNILDIPLGIVSWWRLDDEQDFVGENHCNPVNIIDGGERGKVARFDSNPASCGADASLNIENDIGISFWIKTFSLNGEPIKKGNNYGVFLENGFISFNYGKKVKSQKEVNDNHWHHIVATMTGIYIDGQLSSSKILDREGKINSENFELGNFNGFLDEVMLFDEPLSNIEVEGIYNNQKI